MNTQPLKLILACTLALGTICSAANASEPVSQQVIDARQESQIWTTYALNPHLRANNLSVSVHKGTATLTGMVEEGVNKDLAKQIALGVTGIKEVNNQIVVQAGYIVPASAGDRSYGDVIDDATITAAVKSKLLWSKHADGLTTDVDTKSGRVTLKGTATSAVASDLASRLVLNTRGVLSVDNQLVVNGVKPTTAAVTATKTAAQQAEKDISDSWITTKVKSTFLYSSNVDGAEITVSTKSGIVTLSGKISSGAERALAIELAKNVRGVKSVYSKNLTL